MKDGNRLVASGVSFLAGAAVLGGILWFAFGGDDIPSSASRELPIIRADAESYSRKPEEPGGMDIPYQNSTVFQSFAGLKQSDTADRVENLLPPTEEPMPKETYFKEVTEPAVPKSPMPAQTAAMPEEPVEMANKIVTKQMAPEKVVDKDIAIKTDPMPKVIALDVPVQEKQIETAVKAMPEPTEQEAKAAAKIEPAIGAAKVPGTHFVQLGSLTSREAAKTQWDRVRKEFPAQLSTMSLNIQQANLGAKGTYYRVQAGPVSKSQAASVCDAIKAQKPGACLVVKK